MDNTIGIETWGGGNRKQKSKSSKLQLVTEISTVTGCKSLDITVLSTSELETILSVASTGGNKCTGMPLGRYKKPYIEALTPLFPTVRLTKLSVSALKELIGAFLEKNK